MNKKTILTAGALVAAALLAGIGIGHYVAGDITKESASDALTTQKTDEATKPTIWTCSMHPQIRQTKPGKCPICGMDLIPLVEEAGGQDGPRVLSMSEASRALADIQTTLVRQDFPEADIRLVGKLDYDETREKSLAARFPARIDELFVNYTGIRVAAGDRLATVYSPELLSAQRELLTAYRAGPDSSLTRVARDKLRLWDLLPEQIDEIVESGKARDHFELKAPVGGVVVAKNVKEGDYVKTGEPLFKIVDLSELWATLDAYESDLPWLREGQDVTFTVESVPGETFHGEIVFIEPVVDRKTRTIPVRLNVPNGDERLKPGMFVRAEVKARLGAGGSVDEAESPPVIVPASAVLRTGKRAVVYVEKPVAERPTYDGREIVLGPRAGDHYIVVSGLDAGEHVVTHGAFKIDSALQIQAKPSMMNPEGGGPMPGHNHGGSTPAASSGEHASNAGMTMLEIPADKLPALLDPYLKMQTALAADDLSAAKEQAKSMMAITGHSGSLPALLHDMLAAETLEAFRLPSFESLSDALIMAAKQHPDSLTQPLVVMHCPMANNNAGANWIQASEPLQNPYYGPGMLGCGDVTETIGDETQDHSDHEQ
ncbi:MAG: efflux RND transporter periplasmic adaptor subunit [Puniceicoccales bacterium]